MSEPDADAQPSDQGDSGSADDGGRLQCQFCGSYSVGRLYLASVRADSCECQSCGARWEEESTSGRYLGRGATHSVITNRSR